VRRPRLELQAREDRLAREPVADRPRQPEVGGARQDPLLARGEIETCAAGRDHVVDGVQDLARAADREGLDAPPPRASRSSPRLARPVLLELSPRKSLFT
jgi:hypothetical protein